MNHDLAAYYAERAQEYELVYHKPERQQDLLRMTGILQDLFRNRHVLELACGTGWWTQHLAITASSILATDINEPVLEIARTKTYPPDKVLFQRDDIYQSTIDRQFDALFAGFFWSHVPLEQLDAFLTRCFQWVRPGGLLVFADNLFIPNSNTPVDSTDEAGNTFQLRRLQDGSSHRVLKNFPEPSFVVSKLQQNKARAAFFPLDYYWLALAYVD